MTSVRHLLAACFVLILGNITLASAQLTGAASVASGYSHTCTLLTSGGVMCWGANNEGQLGDGTETARNTPDYVTGATSGVSYITAGNDYNCLVTSSGGAKCWGRNQFGQLGDSTTVDRSSPVQVVGLSSGVSAIAAGWYATCALTTSGGAKCWGRNDHGQLGDGTTIDRITPVNVSGLASGVASIGRGEVFTCATTTAGGAKCWGGNAAQQIGDGSSTERLTPVDVSGLTSDVVMLDVGRAHACAVTTAGGVMCWGSAVYGQLGNGSYNVQTTPVAPTGLTSGVSSVAAGDGYTCARTTAEAVSCWGRNDKGQLNSGDLVQTTTPHAILEVLSGVQSISAGFDHTCILSSGGSLKCWGSNASGQLGDGTTTLHYLPNDVTGLTSGMYSVASGQWFSCANTGSGQLKCWGAGNFGQLGNGSYESHNVPVVVTGFTGGAHRIATGTNHSCVVTTGGAVKCWGANSYGEIGDGTIGSKSTPVAVSGLGSGVSYISAGQFSTCAVTNLGGVQCWGHNGNGRLGDGTTTDSMTPVAVSGLTSGVVALRVGESHVCAVTSLGGVKCWGKNFSSQLGDGTFTDRSSPVNVIGLTSGVSSVALGTSHTCALTTAGGVKCWGRASNGQTGQAGSTYTLTATAVPGLASGVAMIDARDNYSCALLSTGGIKCWGANSAGQLGNGETEDSSTPVDVLGLTSGVYSLSVGTDHLCVLTTQDGVKCRGVNKYGQLGTHDYHVRSVLQRRTIQGTVSLEGAPLAGVALTATGMGELYKPQALITDSSGTYSFSFVETVPYTILPSLTGYSFAPPSLTGLVSVDLNQDFIGTSTATTSIATSTTISTTTSIEPSTTTSSTTSIAPSTTTSTTTVPDIDSDSDGLTDSEESALGTNPSSSDSDSDGVPDAEEVATGTDPLDAGSQKPKLRTTLCTEWNGFLGGPSGSGMYNILEHINLSTKRLAIKTELRSSVGKLKDTVHFSIKGGAQYDVLVHDMKGRDVNSYGQVCSKYQGATGILDGQMVYYKFDAGNNIEFAFGIPFENPLTGVNYLVYNTNQPSTNAGDVDDLVANWVQLSNASQKEMKGKIYVYSASGGLAGSETVKLAAGARSDFAMHKFGKAKIGLVRFVPQKSNLDYYLRGVRYLYDNVGTSDSFSSAYPTSARRGSGQSLVAPFYLGGGTAELEIANTLKTKANAEIVIYDASGKTKLYKKVLSLKAYSTTRVGLTSQTLADTKGIIVVKGSQRGSLIANLLSYARNSGGEVQNMVALPLVEPIGTVQQGSYNTFLGQGCSLMLANSSSAKEKVTVSLPNAIKGSKSFSLTIPAHGMITDNICGRVAADTYGTVKITAPHAKRVTGVILRLGKEDRYRIATPIR